MDRRTLYKSLEASDQYYKMVFTQPLSPLEQIRAVNSQKITGFWNELTTIESHLKTMEAELGHKYSPSQPRVPAGNPAGGQWTSGNFGSGVGAEVYVPAQPKPSSSTPPYIPSHKPDNNGSIMNYDDGGEYDDWDYGDGGDDTPVYDGEPDLPIEPVYPLEELLGLWAGGELFSSFDIFGGGAAGAAEGGIDAGTEIGGMITEGSAEDLSVEQSQNLIRFEKNLPNGATETRISNLPDGSKVLESDVPANNIPGSYATYQKTIDASGKTVRYTKTTYAPDGSIVHTKVKFP